MKNKLKKTVVIPIRYTVEITNGTQKDRRHKMRELIKEIRETHNQSSFGVGTAPSGETYGYSYKRLKG